ncbi:MAG TPA: ATP-binding protein [Firmicutes bacterium]|nr:ATP-binding protein [Bacillota bacterium]
MKLLRNRERAERDGLLVPRSVQQSIPIRRIYRGGVWQVGGKFSRTWGFSDINYSVASPEDQTDLFLRYSAILNSLPTDGAAKITIVNHRLNPDEFAKTVLLPRRWDRLDEYRREYNAILTDKAGQSNNLIRDRYLTVSSLRKDGEDARAYFSRVQADLSAGFQRLGSSFVPMDNTERLRILHDFFRAGEEPFFRFDLSETMRKGHDFRDYICPDSLEFKADHFLMGNKVGRVLFLREYASYLKDDFIKDLSDFGRRLMVSIDILPVATDEATKEVQKRILAVEADITRWQRRQNSNYNLSAEVPYELELMRTEAREYMDDLTNRDQRMMFAVLTLVHLADNKKQLDEDTETILSIGRKHLCQIAILRYQQEDGLNTVLPYGLRRIRALRTLTTESTAVLMPFVAQEIMQEGGVYYGLNAVSRNPIICNRKRLLNANGFIVGTSGSGKSFFAKEEMFSIALSTEDDILIIDPEREYAPPVQALGGEVIRLAAGSPHHINAMDMVEGYGGDDNPLAAKADFLLSLFEQLLAGKLGAAEKSIIDRCTAKVYAEKGGVPTLRTLREELLRQPEPEALQMALAAELFTEGSLNVFAHPTNINLSSRIMAFDILDLGTQLKTVGMLVMLDYVLNRVTANRKKGRYTHIYIDEIHLFFANEYSAAFLAGSWKRFRKYGAIPTAITQNVEECLRSETARLMLANSEFLIMLNQAATDRAELARLLHISDTQLSYITDPAPGRGLIRVGGTIVPFVNEFPRDTALYRMMTTKPGEC